MTAKKPAAARDPRRAPSHDPHAPRAPRARQEIANRLGYSCDAAAHTAVKGFIQRTGNGVLLGAIRGTRARPSGYVTSGGYREVSLPGHPLASRHGRVKEHRRVLYDAIGPGPHPCSGCGRILEWSALDVDHINFDQLDNRVENLRPCCRGCNSRFRWARWRAGVDYPAWMDDPGCPDDFQGWGEYVA